MEQSKWGLLHERAYVARMQEENDDKTSIHVCPQWG